MRDPLSRKIPQVVDYSGLRAQDIAHARGERLAGVASRLLAKGCAAMLDKRESLL